MTTAEPANYPRDLDREVVSDASTVYRLRPILPDDAARSIEFHRHLAPRSSISGSLAFIEHSRRLKYSVSPVSTTSIDWRWWRRSTDV